jgi:iron complex outermembrane recepter protein
MGYLTEEGRMELVAVLVARVGSLSRANRGTMLWLALGTVALPVLLAQEAAPHEPREKEQAESTVSDETSAGEVTVQGPDRLEAPVTEEITVSAGFREESLQDAPIAITAMTADAMRARGADTVHQAAQRAPNVQLRPASLAFGPALNAYIRGVGQDDFNFALEPGVGMYVDDIYYPTLTGTDFQVLDLERVEVLRGPQGTVQGRNSIGGAVRLITRKAPSRGTGFVELDFGQDDRLGVRAAAGFDLVRDVLSGRFAGLVHGQDGYVERLDFACDRPEIAASLGIAPSGQAGGDCRIGTLGGKEYSGARLSLRFAPSDRLRVDFSGDSAWDRSEAAANVLVAVAGTPFDPAFGPWFITPDRLTSYETFTDPAGGATGVPFTTPANSELDGRGGAAVVDYQVGSRMSVQSITSYRELDASFPTATDSSPLNGETGFQSLDGESFQQEVRVQGTIARASLEYTVGLFYFDQKNRNRNRIDIGYLPFVFDFLSDEIADSRSTALFAQGVWRAGERANLTLGARYSDERKDQVLARLDPVTGGTTPHPSPLFADFAANGGSLSNTFEGDHLDYRATIDYRFNDRLMTYASVATGFKSGGVNPRPFNGAQVVPFGIEEVRALELGWKSDLLRYRLRVNGALFWNDYSDIQLTPTSCPDLSPGPCAAPRNLGDADIWGAELESTFQASSRLQLDASASFVRLDFTRLAPEAIGPVDPTLDAPESTPPLKLGLGGQYDLPLGAAGMLIPRIDFLYEDEKQGLAGTSSLAIDSYTVLDARLAWRPRTGPWEVALAISNLTDEQYFYNVFDIRNIGAWAAAQPAPPRRWAFTVRRSLGRF